MTDEHTVGVVTERVRRWVEEEGSRFPGFLGAYLFGGITQLPPDEPFPDYRDVDVIFVSTEGTRDQTENIEMSLDGTMIEVGIWGQDAHASAETILSNPILGPNFAATTILADPIGILEPLRAAVAAAFPEYRWTLARCETERLRLMEHLESIRMAGSVSDKFGSLWYFTNYVSGLLALASLQKPTHRRTLTLLKEILLPQGETELYEDALRVWGAATMSRDRVNALILETAQLYDEAVAVYRTPTPFSFKLKQHLKPYFIDASREIFEEGNHREATFWLALGFAVPYNTILLDGSEAQKQLWQPRWEALLQDFDLDNPEKWPARVADARAVADRTLQVTERILATNPSIRR